MFELILESLSYICDFFGYTYIAEMVSKFHVKPTIPDKPVVKVYDTSLKTIENNYFNFTLKGLFEKIYRNSKSLFISEIPKTYLTPENYNKNMKLFTPETFKFDSTWIQTTCNKEITTLENFTKTNPTFLTEKDKYKLLSTQSTMTYSLYDEKLKELNLNSKKYGVVIKTKNK